MLNSKRDKLTVSILKKLQSRGLPEKGNIGSIPLVSELAGEEEVEEEDVPLDSEGAVVQSRGDLLKKKYKKK